MRGEPSFASRLVLLRSPSTPDARCQASLPMLSTGNWSEFNQRPERAPRVYVPGIIGVFVTSIAPDLIASASRFDVSPSWLVRTRTRLLEL